jgi:phospholipase C
MPAGNGLPSIEHIVVLMLENRSFDHMLGFLYTDNGNLSPLGQPYEGLNGTESNPASAGSPVSVFRSGSGAVGTAPEWLRCRCRRG